MNTKKEVVLVTIKNMLLMYTIMILGMALVMGLKTQWRYDNYSTYYIFIFTLVYVTFNNLVQLFRLNYRTKSFINLNEINSVLESYLSSKKCKELSSDDEYTKYSIRSKYSISRLNVSIIYGKEAVKVTAPNIILEDICKKMGQGSE